MRALTRIEALTAPSLTATGVALMFLRVSRSTLRFWLKIPVLMFT